MNLERWDMGIRVMQDVVNRNLPIRLVCFYRKINWSEKTTHENIEFACAAGYMALDPRIQKMGLRPLHGGISVPVYTTKKFFFFKDKQFFGEEAVEEFFGITQEEFFDVFAMNGYPKSPSGVTGQQILTKMIQLKEKYTNA